MEYFKCQPNSTAVWYTLVQDAALLAGYQVAESVENYLILTLDNHMNNNSISSRVLALDFLNATNLNTKQNAQQMRSVGDHCLILSGLFPERALKKNVTLEYFIGMGKNAYHQLSSVSPHLKLDNELFYQLSQEFLGLMNLLAIIRELPNQTKQ
ncbi:MAG: hypothetical protein K0U29_01085 [Gammaproteobacteria bacterium]|nr:hypothetical protein [Gammaproteobacteria bacterium]MCH9743500.1 hypothetical protein [Gammaproteobacteria bacterium]